MSRCGAIGFLVSTLFLSGFLPRSAIAVPPFLDSSRFGKESQGLAVIAPGSADASAVATAAVTPSASLCVHVTSTCHVVGSTVKFVVELGESESSMTFAQFSLQYDRSALRFLSIAPGATHDSQSPFSMELGRIVDESEGTIGYAVGVDSSAGGTGTQGPATLAELSFAIRETGSDPLCLFDAGNPFFTLLSGQNGESVPIDNSLNCPPSAPLPVLACAEVEVSQTCYCEGGTPDCGPLDSDCSVGTCNDQTGQCEAMPGNEGGPCDDGSVCTTADTCRRGVCTGAGCPNPSVCVVAEDDCQAEDGSFLAKVILGRTQTNDLITAAQLNLEFDPNAFELVSAEAGITCDPESPFIESGFLEVDNVAGHVFLLVSVDPIDFAAGAGTMGPATLACLRFGVKGPPETQICLVAGANPRFTLLANQFGSRVAINNSQDCPTPPGVSALACDEPCPPIPATSAWGLANLALLLACAGKIRFGRIRRSA